MPKVEPYTKAWYCMKLNISLTTLHSWMSHATLKKALKAAGYNVFQKKLTPKQHNILVGHLQGDEFTRHHPLSDEIKKPVQE